MVPNGPARGRIARRAASSFGRFWACGAGKPRVQGIRFRLGLAMAIALLPILLLGAFEAQVEFRRQADDRRNDLQFAAERTAEAAQSRLDSVSVLLGAIAPEASGPACGPRLAALVQRLDGYDSLYRVGMGGQTICDSKGAPRVGQAVSFAGHPWFQRLRQGESVTLARASADLSHTPALVIGARWERPRGVFAGAMAAVLPLSELQPDITDPSLPADTQAALTDADGRVLVATDIRDFTFAEGPGLLGWVERAREGGASVFEADDASGEHRDYAGAALAGRDVYLVISAPSPGLLSWARLNPIGVLILPLAAWLTAFSAVMLVSERIVVRWLDYLERIAALYARGRYSVRPVQAAHAPAEIRLLARTLDELAEAIAARDRSLNESLSEKDALMREIHHRVKNNLQIISSLLSMQQRALKDEPAKAALGDTRQRISALALIYRTLYQSDDIRHADAREFMTELVGQMVASESGRGFTVTSSIDADSLVVDPDKLAPLALWLVEAITNAQKHAFAGRGGALQVRFRVHGDTSTLEVQDDGPGSSDEAVRSGVGRTLMGAFAKQLRGEAELVPAPGGGTIARMVFATPEAVVPTNPDDLKPSDARVTPGTLSRTSR
ncbi:sensor histidine kinase [Brevundimonas sp.]|uniref:sensor histidine kinase PhyK n=1 Tax=Brevundimonas sp. TaxID=1871086 RepID=UPI00286D1DD6|nr:sensor histidine kinase [Brevundimonas sp.]